MSDPILPPPIASPGAPTMTKARTLADFATHDEDCPQSNQRGWLIEHYCDPRGDSIQPEWWDGVTFRTNANHAIRYSREIDAKSALSLLRGNAFAFDCRVTEHLWTSDHPCSCGLSALLQALPSERETMTTIRDPRIAQQREELERFVIDEALPYFHTELDQLIALVTEVTRAEARQLSSAARCPECGSDQLKDSKVPDYCYCTRCGRGSIPLSHPQPPQETTK